MFYFVFASFLISSVDFIAVDGNINGTKLVENIRRQLMVDNYDYMSSGSEDSLTVNQSINGDIKDGDNFSDGNRRKLTHEIIIPRAKNDDDRNVQDVTALDKDLVYYTNDERLEEVTVGNLDDYDLSEDFNATTPKVKYKVLKVKNPNRRTMTLQRLIQEEKDDGVAIINLDDGPFPEFRLPKSRRQYMQDTEEFEDSIDSEIDDETVENSTIS